MKKKKISFDQWFIKQFGSRWQNLKKAMKTTENKIAYTHNLNKPYFLDAGSVEIAQALPLDNVQTILDLCAAPGGKSVVLASRMETTAHLTANDFSRTRKKRLISVVNEYLPDWIKNRITVTGYNASLWCKYEQNAYERILLDVPCSSERHVLSSKKYFDQWTPARIRNLSHRQWALLSSAWLVLKPKGYLVYSTCALSEQENDHIIEKLLKKYQNVKVCDIMENMLAEKTVHGYRILPDVCNGSGPLFYSILYKEN